MNRKLFFILITVILIGFQPVFAQEVPDVESAPGPAALYDIPPSLSDNQYFQESQRLAMLAREAYALGDYDASTEYAHESIYYAILSDVHITIAIAKSRIDSAVATGASKHYPSEFGEAETWYDISLKARDAENWEDSLEAAQRVIALLDFGHHPLPATYTVREWVTFRDCFWNIAGHPWVYGDPFQWLRLYEANKWKLPDPNNPNLIEPGIVLDIPSLKGEVRQGEWDSGRSYLPIQ